MINLAFADVCVIAIYFFTVVFIGFRTTRRRADSSVDYLLAGRSLTLPVFVMTLVSTWYGGILGVGEFSYRYGISNWVVQGVPYYVFAALFAFLLAGKVRSSKLFSIPDKLEAAYDRKTALLGAWLTFLLMTPAPYILMLGLLLEMLFGWGLTISIVVIVVVTVSYEYAGGFRSDIQTDVFEFFVMFAGFAVIIPFCIGTYGGFSFLASHLPSNHLTWHGGNSMQYILVWFFIALWTLVDPAFHQRCYAARDESTAKKGILISILFWFAFDSMTAIAGLYARAALPDLGQPVLAFPLLAESVLPPVAKGLFYAGMLATMMSTLNTLAFVSAQTLGRDVAWRMLKGSGDSLEGSNSIRLTQIGLPLSFGLAIVIAILVPSVVEMWYLIGTTLVPGLLVPLVASYFDRLRIPSRYAFASMLSGWLVSTIWLIARRFDSPFSSIAAGVEPMYPGLLASLLFWGIGRIRLRRS
jgi:SSS family solute:Na+ symporter